MSEKIILYPNVDTGGVILLFPVLDCGLTVEQIAQKDVPAGLPYTIVDASTIPTDKTFRDAWEYGTQ